MAYQYVEDFKYGMDRRRPRFAGVPGTIWDAENVVLSRGGDVERSKRFVPLYTALANTFGVADLNGRVFVFGSADLAGSMPAGVNYQRLQAPSGAAMTRVVSVEKFDNRLYVVADFDDGNRHHFYNGARVTQWDTVASALASANITYTFLAELLSGTAAVSAEPTGTGVLLTSRVPGTAFTLSASMVNGGGVNDQTATVTTVQANVPGVAAVRATAAITITGGSFDPNVNTLASLRVGATLGAAIDLLGGPVSYVSSDTATANSIAVAINDRTVEHGYTAAVAGATVTVSAIPGSGAAANAYFLFPETAGDVTTSGTAAFSGGANAVAPVAQISRIAFGGTFEALDQITVTLNGTVYRTNGRAAATGERLYVAHNRIWTTAGPALYYCELNDPTDWTTVTPSATDPGRIVVSTDATGAQRLTGIAAYQGYAAIFAGDTVVVYQLDTDPANFGRVQELPNTGTLAGGAVQTYGANDLFYLDATGIRSLQQRDSSQAAFVSDAGMAFDPYVQERVAAAPLEQVRLARAVIEPRTGAYWLAVGAEVFVLSNYPGTGIRGWTRLTPGFSPTAFARSATRLLVRDATTIYVYGGVNGDEYPLANETPARVKLPFMTARDEAGFKNLIGLDVGAVNEWLVKALVNPNDETQIITVGRLIGLTYVKDNTEMLGETTHVAMEFECSRAGAALIANMAVHHEGRLRA